MTRERTIRLTRSRVCSELPATLATGEGERDRVAIGHARYWRRGCLLTGLRGLILVRRLLVETKENGLSDGGMVSRVDVVDKVEIQVHRARRERGVGAVHVLARRL